MSTGTMFSKGQPRGFHIIVPKFIGEPIYIYIYTLVYDTCLWTPNKVFRNHAFGDHCRRSLAASSGGQRGARKAIFLGTLRYPRYPGGDGKILAYRLLASGLRYP